MKILIVCFILIAGITENTSVTGNLNSKYDKIRYEDKVHIKEAFSISELLGNKIWSKWNEAPFLIIVITDENEYLFSDENNSGTDGFVYSEFDTITQKHVYTRTKKFGSDLLATFPAVSGISTIVIGLPENTSLTSAQWVSTLLHEHFHQLQQSRQDYFESVNNLGLAGDDNTGMWMLNYGFPYKEETLSAKYKELVLTAKRIYLENDTEKLKSKFANYKLLRDSFKKMINEKDYIYFSFQIWQEGIARYTELKAAELMSEGKFEHSEKYSALEDYVSPDTFYNGIINQLMVNADKQELNINKRECFYTLGALEGLILDRINPGWKERYFPEKFFVEKYFE